MGRSFAIFLVLILTGGLAKSLFKLTELTRQNENLTHENKKQEDEIRSLRGSLLKEHMKEKTEYLAEKTSVEDLQQKVKSQQESVDLAEDRLRRARNFGDNAKELQDLRDRQNGQKALIQDLENSLKGIQQRVHQIDSLRGVAKQQAAPDRFVLKQQEQDIQGQIRDEKANLSRMQNDVQSGASRKKLQEDEVRSADSDLKAQKAKLGELRSRLQGENQKLKMLDSGT